MSNKPGSQAPPSTKETGISKADELVKGSDVELSEEELKRVSGGSGGKPIKDGLITIRK
jgi:bacteriocin-like protein